jgi:hypothetical protein
MAFYGRVVAIPTIPAEHYSKRPRLVDLNQDFTATTVHMYSTL